MTDTKQPGDLDKSPFADLFKRYPWLPYVLMTLRRQMGMWHEFLEVHVKPFTAKPPPKHRK